jgi:hypothetical protein
MDDRLYECWDGRLYRLVDVESNDAGETIMVLELDRSETASDGYEPAKWRMSIVEFNRTVCHKGIKLPRFKRIYV